MDDFTLLAFMEVFNLTFGKIDEDVIPSKSKSILFLFCTNDGVKQMSEDTLRKAAYGKKGNTSNYIKVVNCNSETAKKFIKNNIDDEYLDRICSKYFPDIAEQDINKKVDIVLKKCLDVSQKINFKVFDKKEHIKIANDISKEIEGQINNEPNTQKRENVLTAQTQNAIQLTDNAPSEDRPLLCVSLAAKKAVERAMNCEGRLISFNNSSENFLEMPGLSSYVSGNDNFEHKLADLYLGKPATEAENYLLVGKGGCGKTFMLFDLARKLMAEKNGCAIPVYIPLNNLKSDENNNYILTYFINTVIYNRPENANPSGKDILDCLSTCTGDTYFLFLLDGFNEITSEEKSRAIVGEIIGLQSEYPSLRFVISSRYDISQRFTVRGLKMPFSGKKVLPLFRETIEDAVREKNPDFSLNGWSDKQIDIISSPMSLMMYISMYNKNKNINAPSSLGCLIEEYISQIRDLGSIARAKDNDLGKYTDLLKLLDYIGYRMNMDGFFELPKLALCGYIKEFGRGIRLEEFAALPAITDVFYISEDSNTSTSHFIHQNFRDYFCAKYLTSVLTESERELTTKIFSRRIPHEVLVLLADILKEAQCIDDPTNSQIQQALDYYYKNKDLNGDSAAAVAQLVDIAAIGRKNNLGYMDFSGLNLTKTALNGKKLYRIKDSEVICANFNKSVIGEYTFKASGSPAAVYAVCVIENRYIVMFAKDSVLCFDFLERVTYCPVNSIPEQLKHSVTSVVCSEREKVLLTGSRFAENEDLFWSYSIENSILSLQFKNKLDTPCKPTQNILIMPQKGNPLRFLIVKNDGECVTYSPNDDTISGFCETIKKNTNTDVKAYADISGKEIFTALGKRVYRLTENCSWELLYKWDNKKIKAIRDILVTRQGKKTWILLNGTAEQNKEKNKGRHAVRAIRLDDMQHPVDLPLDSFNDRANFFGFTNFAKGANGEICLGVNASDNVLPNFFMLEYIQDDWNVQPFYGRQTMSVESLYTFESGGSRYIATGSVDRSLQIMCVDSRRSGVEEHIRGYYDGITTTAFGKINGEPTIFTGQYSGEISAWIDSGDGYRCVRTYRTHYDWLWGLKTFFREKQLFLLSCSYDHTICITRADNETELCRIRVDSKVLSIDVTENGGILASYGNSLELFSVDYNSGEHNTITRVTPAENGKCRFAAYGCGIIAAVVNYNDKSSELYVYSLGNNGLKPKPPVRKYENAVFRSIALKEVNGEPLIIFGGTINHSDALIILQDEKVLTLTLENGEKDCCGISAVDIMVDDEITFAASSYNSIGYVGKITLGQEITCDAIRINGEYSKIIDVKIHNGKMYFGAISGELIEYDPQNDKVAVIFHTMCGYEMNGINFTEVSENSDGFDNLSDRFKEWLKD